MASNRTQDHQPVANSNQPVNTSNPAATSKDAPESKVIFTDFASI